MDLLSGHSGPVVSIQTHEHKIVSGSIDSTIKIWQKENEGFVCVSTMQSEKKAIFCLDLIRNIIVTGGSNGTVKIWDISKGICTKTFNCSSKTIFSVSILPNGTMIVGSSDGYITCLDMNSGSNYFTKRT
jgi:WD40 repeat protein